MQFLKNRFGIPGVIAVAALVFAMIGGAYAATNSGGGKKASASKSNRGPRGPKGPKGATGPAGATGAQGAQGAAGANGKDGAPGSPGEAGPPGAPGANGSTILSGTTAPAAGLGNNGDFYIRTNTEEIYGPKTAGAWGSPTALKGSPGTNGKTILSGTAAPENTEGADGDFFLRTDTAELYGPKTSGAWGSPTALKGPPGAEGSPWVAGKAPSGVVMKGTWSLPPYVAAAAGEELLVPISTGIPVGTGEILAEKGPAPGLCEGTAAEPKVASFFPGLLCVYPAEETNAKLAFVNPALNQSGGGALLHLETKGAGTAKAYGTWALFTP